MVDTRKLLKFKVVETNLTVFTLKKNMSGNGSKKKKNKCAGNYINKCLL